MLVNLHVKNFAIIDEADIDFGEHLNIMTGETGAGKSIMVGSLSIALGARVSPEVIGKRGDYAMVEAVFHLQDEQTLEKIRELDIEPEDGELVISRKIMPNRSVNKINGESVSVGTIRKVAALCIDIHGQNENQSLLDSERHREIVDGYGGDENAGLLDEISSLYRDYAKRKRELEQDSLPEEERARQLGFLEYEKNEIEAAALKEGEIEQVEADFRRMSSASDIVEALGEVHQLTGETVSGAISHALGRLKGIVSLDSSLADFEGELLQIEALISDFNRDVSGFMEDFSFDEGELRQMEQRMDCIHSLQNKYGDTFEKIMAHLDEVNEKLEKFNDFEAYQQKKREEFEAVAGKLASKCEKLSARRKKIAEKLGKEIEEALLDLNFAHVDFAIEVRESEQFSLTGKDEVEFMIATNPGEPRRSLGKIASGGELSRIMLAIKSVFAESDSIETLIFDEIDTGISGRTAQKVAEKMGVIGKSHQVICITHLAQIAAMADRHFVIEKEVEEDASTTVIRQLSGDQIEEELSRLLGGAEITDAVRENAREMKAMAEKIKQ